MIIDVRVRIGDAGELCLSTEGSVTHRTQVQCALVCLLFELAGGRSALGAVLAEVGEAIAAHRMLFPNGGPDDPIAIPRPSE